MNLYVICFTNTDCTFIKVLLIACCSSSLARWDLTVHGNITWS